MSTKSTKVAAKATDTTRPVPTGAEREEWIARARDLSATARNLRFESAKFCYAAEKAGAIGEGSVWATRKALGDVIGSSNVGHLIRLGDLIERFSLDVDSKEYSLLSSAVGGLGEALKAEKVSKTSVLKAARAVEAKKGKGKVPTPRAAASEKETPEEVPAVVLSPAEEAVALVKRLAEVASLLTDAQYAHLLTGLGRIEKKENTIRQAARDAEAAKVAS